MIFRKRAKEAQLGNVNIATPATHESHLESEPDFGTQILKGFDTGWITFGGETAIITTRVKSWDYAHCFLPMMKTQDLYILADSWVGFRIDKEIAPLWEAWLTANYPE